MRKVILLSFLLTFLLLVDIVKAQDISCGQNLDCINQKIAEYEVKIGALMTQANTLANQVAQFDTQIKLTTLKIEQTQEKVNLLGGRIDLLENSLDTLSRGYASRVVETYKMVRFGDPAMMFITSTNLTRAVEKFQYLKRIQNADQNLLTKLQGAQTSYRGEKAVQESLQTELTKQKANLSNQKAAKAQLLAATKNDEKKYQQLLSSARAELEAIQSIIAGQGQETEAGRISEGQKIASIISSASACSSGAHLHFEVVKDGANQNPASYLTPKSVIWDNSPDGQFSFGGSWQWPVGDPIKITQGYGMTYYASQLRYYGGGPHTGLDMLSAGSDWTVKSVKPGTLYRGAIGCGGGTLRYVHVRQDDGLNVYYLHVNY